MIAMSCPAAAAVQVEASNSALTLLGEFGPGTYQYNTTGIIGMAGPVGTGFDVNADGTPQGVITVAGYEYFNPAGADNDYGTFGPAGPGINLGALAGRFSNGGTNFQLGQSGSFTLASTASLFGFVNDTYYQNNSGSFTFSASAVSGPVPEPGTWAMMLCGFGALGFSMRRRRKDNARVRFAF